MGHMTHAEATRSVPLVKSSHDNDSVGTTEHHNLNLRNMFKEHTLSCFSVPQVERPAGGRSFLFPPSGRGGRGSLCLHERRREVQF